MKRTHWGELAVLAILALGSIGICFGLEDRIVDQMSAREVRKDRGIMSRFLRTDFSQNFRKSP